MITSDNRNIPGSPLKANVMRNLKFYQNNKRVHPRDIRYSSSHLDKDQKSPDEERRCGSKKNTKLKIQPKVIWRVPSFGLETSSAKNSSYVARFTTHTCGEQDLIPVLPPHLSDRERVNFMQNLQLNIAKQQLALGGMNNSRLNPYQDGQSGKNYLEDELHPHTQVASSEMGKYDFQFDNQLNLKQIIRPKHFSQQNQRKAKSVIQDYDNFSSEMRGLVNDGVYSVQNNQSIPINISSPSGDRELLQTPSLMLEPESSDKEPTKATFLTAGPQINCNNFSSSNNSYHFGAKHVGNSTPSKVHGGLQLKQLNQYCHNGQGGGFAEKLEVKSASNNMVINEDQNFSFFQSNNQVDINNNNIKASTSSSSNYSNGGGSSVQQPVVFQTPNLNQNRQSFDQNYSLGTPSTSNGKSINSINLDPINLNSSAETKDQRRTSLGGQSPCIIKSFVTKTEDSENYFSTEPGNNEDYSLKFALLDDSQKDQKEISFNQLFDNFTKFTKEELIDKLIVAEQMNQKLLQKTQKLEKALISIQLESQVKTFE